MKMIHWLTALLVFLFAASSYAEDFSLSRDGIGPISVHTTLTYKGNGEHLSARAVNDSGKPIPYVKLCVTAETKGCLFTLWNTSTWEAGAELTWDFDTKTKVRNLSHEVSMAPAAGQATLVSATVAKKASVEWLSAKVLSQDMQTEHFGSASLPIGTAVVNVPLSRTSSTVVLDTGNEIVTWIEITKNGRITLPVNGSIRYYLEKGVPTVLDSAGKKHVFAVSRIELNSSCSP